MQGAAYINRDAIDVLEIYGFPWHYKLEKGDSKLLNHFLSPSPHLATWRPHKNHAAKAALTEPAWG